MADIILPDDVFVNMQNAQEEAKSMKEAVTEFNKNVSEKFTDKDANKDAKVENEINPRLTTSEKTRYSNIGSAFFEGAKTQILDIFKEIEKNKKKNIFKRTTAAVREQMEQIKEFTEEHKTHGKILLAIAAIGGIYYLFKDWFDENMPKIWDKLTKAISEFADAAGKLASEIATKITDSNILGSIKDFIVDTGKTIADFFKTLGGHLTSIFTVSNSAKSKNKSQSEKIGNQINEFEEKRKNDAVYDTVAGIVGDMSASNDSEGIANTLKSLRDMAKMKDDLLAEKASGNITSRTKEELDKKLEKLDKQIASKQELLAKYNVTVDDVNAVIKSQHELATGDYSKQIKEGKADLEKHAMHQLAKIMDSVSDPSQLTEAQKQQMIEIYTKAGYSSDFIKHSQQWWYASDSNR